MNPKAARRAFEISDSAILRRIIQARAMVAGSDADILFAATGIMITSATVINYGKAIDNASRLESYGSPVVGWVPVTVDPNDAVLFRIEPHAEAPGAGLPSPCGYALNCYRSKSIFTEACAWVPKPPLYSQI